MVGTGCHGGGLCQALRSGAVQGLICRHRGRRRVQDRFGCGDAAPEVRMDRVGKEAAQSGRASGWKWVLVEQGMQSGASGGRMNLVLGCRPSSRGLESLSLPDPSGLTSPAPAGLSGAGTGDWTLPFHLFFCDIGPPVKVHGGLWKPSLSLLFWGSFDPMVQSLGQSDPRHCSFSPGELYRLPSTVKTMNLSLCCPLPSRNQELPGREVRRREPCQLPPTPAFRGPQLCPWPFGALSGAVA